MQATLIERAQAYFLDRCGIAFDALIAPIEAAMPGGRPVRGQACYRTIEYARHDDDAGLPLGSWAHDLKGADWDRVSSVAADTLARHSKDLQVAAWLLEARIHKDGFDGIAPCILLLQALCERFWDNLHPQAEDGDMEHRANVIRWIDRKLSPVLRMAPLTGVAGERAFNWVDWEQAQRNERLREQLRGQGRDTEHGTLDGPSCAEVLAAMSATPLDAHAQRHAMLGDGLQAIGALSNTLGERLGPKPPACRVCPDCWSRFAASSTPN